VPETPKLDSLGCKAADLGEQPAQVPGSGGEHPDFGEEQSAQRPQHVWLEHQPQITRAVAPGPLGPAKSTWKWV
jgi:hypothetical protein